MSATLGEATAPASRLDVVLAGHVDHGKSTVVGRLLADTGALPDGKLAQVRALCERSARPFEFAFLLDALRDERAQGITIDTARVFFRTTRRPYVIIDAPGHIEFLKNMITGAARAQAALLVIDAREGIQENSRRHGALLAMLGIRQVAVLVNKMDLVGYEQAAFEAIVEAYGRYLEPLGLVPVAYIPTSARDGDNVATRSGRLAWYRGGTVLETLEAFEPDPPPADRPLRMPVQDVYKFTQRGDDRRIVAGTIETGALKVGDELVFYPSGKRSHVRTIEAFNRPPQFEAGAGQAVGVTLQEQVYVTRGEIATRATEPPPQVTSRLRVSLFWLHPTPLLPGKEYGFRLGTARVLARVEEIVRVVDTGRLDATPGKQQVDRHEVAECVLALHREIAFDRAEDLTATGRFALVDEHEIRGGGIVREALPDRQAWVRHRVLLRNLKWEPSLIPPERRAERYNQRPTLLLVTGGPGADRKGLAKHLEARLFDDGKIVYFLGIGNVLYGVDADLERSFATRREHIRRLSEVANILLDAGVILIVTAQEITREELELIRTTTDPDRLETIWVGDPVTTDIAYDLHLTGDEGPDEAVQQIKALLRAKGIIYQPR